MKLVVFDYGAGNLHSLVKALSVAGAQVSVETDATRAASGEGLVLPGVGAFAPAAERLAPGLAAVRAAVARGLPVLGVCLGMQLMFEGSDEGAGEGLGLFAGRVTRLAARRVPHIGWNACTPMAAPLPLPAPPLAYYAHSFACRPADRALVASWTTHETDTFPAAVARGRLFGVQFHPEKSSTPGLALLSAFVKRGAA